MFDSAAATQNGKQKQKGIYDDDKYGGVVLGLASGDEYGVVGSEEHNSGDGAADDIQMRRDPPAGKTRCRAESSRRRERSGGRRDRAAALLGILLLTSTRAVSWSSDAAMNCAACRPRFLTPDTCHLATSPLINALLVRPGPCTCAAHRHADNSTSGPPDPRLMQGACKAHAGRRRPVGPFRGVHVCAHACVSMSGGGVRRGLESDLQPMR